MKSRKTHREEPHECLWFGGESGIRTHGTLLAYTRFPGVHLRPLGHLSCTVMSLLRKCEGAQLSLYFRSPA